MVAESRSNPVAARALNLYPKLLYKGKREVQPALSAVPVEALEERQLRAANRRLAQELKISKKAVAFFRPAHRR
jgi:transposase-like protein